MYSELTVSTEYTLTPQDVADQVGTTRQTVSRWARKGQIPCLTTPGGWRRFRQADVDSFLERITHNGVAS